MFRLKADILEKAPKILRYAYYLLTACHPIGFRVWTQNDQPNPFVGRRTPKQPVSQLEISQLLQDVDPFEGVGCGGNSTAASITEQILQKNLRRPVVQRERRYGLAA